MRINSSGAIAAFLLLLAGVAMHVSLELRIAHTPNFDLTVEQIPLSFDEWAGKNVSSLGIRSQEILKLDRYIRRAYSSPSLKEAFVYIGYWKKQSGEYQAAKHSPAMCLPANGWKIDRLPERTLAVEGSELTVNRIVGEIDHQKSLVYYWFFSGKRYYTQEWQSLLWIVWQAVRGERTDGGIVEIIVPISDDESRHIAGGNTEKQLDDFTKRLYLELEKLQQS